MNTVLLTMLLVGHSERPLVYVVPFQPIYIYWSVPRTYQNRPRQISPGFWEAKRARQRQPLSEAGRWDQLRYSVRQNYQRETNPELRELYGKALEVMGDYSQLRAAVAEIRLYKQDQLRWEQHEKERQRKEKFVREAMEQ